MIPVAVAAILVLVASAADARSSSVRRQFQLIQPCPATHSTVGPCPGWVVDHQIPLCAGGRDALSNMQWQRAHEAKLKDIQERAQCRRKSSSKAR